MLHTHVPLPWQQYSRCDNITWKLDIFEKAPSPFRGDHPLRSLPTYELPVGASRTFTVLAWTRRLVGDDPYLALTLEQFLKFRFIRTQTTVTIATVSVDAGQQNREGERARGAMATAESERREATKTRLGKQNTAEGFTTKASMKNVTVNQHICSS